MTERDDPSSQLISLAVHELRTPASVVSGYLRMLQRDVDAPLTDRQRKMVDEAERSCQRLVALVTELSEIQKLDANIIVLADQPFDLFSMIEGLASSVHQPVDRDVRLELKGRQSGATVRGDAARLQRAFLAIFHAILREVPAKTTVVVERRLALRDGSGSAFVIVADYESVQASYEAQPEPFDERRGGLGLTLPMARRVIEKHAGSIWSPAGQSGRTAAVISLPVLELHP